jgi:uncharacterized membrane protein
MASTPEEVHKEWDRATENIPPEQREAMEKIKAAVARHVQRANESAQQMRREIKEILDAHPGQVGWLRGEAEEK